MWPAGRRFPTLAIHYNNYSSFYFVLFPRFCYTVWVLNFALPSFHCSCSQMNLYVLIVELEKSNVGFILLQPTDRVVVEDVAIDAGDPGFNSRLVKSDTVSPTTLHRYEVSSKLCSPGIKPRRLAPPLVTRFGGIPRV